VLAEGKRDELAVKGPIEEGAEVELKLGEVGLHDPQAGVGKLDSLDVCVANASKLVGKKVTARVERVLDGTAYASLVAPEVQQTQPITAEREAEKPTRQPSAAKKAAAEKPKPAPKAKAPAEATDATAEDEPKPKKKTRRGSRGGRGRKKKTAATASASSAGNGAGAAERIEQPVAKIHVPDRELGEGTADEPEPAAAETADGAEAAAKPKKKTRRGTRGGRNRKRKTTATTAAAAVAADGDGPQATPEPDAANEEDWAYVPMSEWADDVLSE
jgi:ribonuclease E